jgi:mono/diheme cytochrome c family protein
MAQGEPFMPDSKTSRPARWLALAAAAAALCLALPAAGGPAPAPELPRGGRELYSAACAACHGPDGKGQPAERLGFQPLPPDFTNCDFASREANLDWVMVANRGGPARAFDRMMPAFGDALTEAQVVEILEHIRTFCTNKAWPRGELNLPRPLFTTKAFPEDEAVVQTTYDSSDPASWATRLYYEQRIGPRGQVELILPYEWVERAGGDEWESGLGDVGLAYKHVVFASLEAGSIVSLAGEVFLPTGDDDKGLGAGTAVFEPYLAWGQILPADFFLHFQAGGAIPQDGAKAQEELFGRLAAGRAFYTGRWGRRWAPMVELLASRELVSGADVLWDVAPQFQVTLSDRQHLRLGLGARIPLNHTDARDARFSVYLLWDWFDGGLLEGW